MHIAFYILLGLTLLTNLICLFGIFYIKGIFRDRDKVFAVAKWVEFLGITLFTHLVLLLTFIIYALATKAAGIALFFLAFLLSPFAIGFAADDYRKADRYITLQLLALLVSLIAIPILASRLP